MMGGERRSLRVTPDTEHCKSGKSARDILVNIVFT